MEIIEVYILFALTTGISSCILFLAPAINMAKELEIQNSFTENTWLSYATYITISTIFAPFTVLPIFIPSFAVRYKLGLRRAVLESQT
jgi:hypothetical protein